MGKYDDLRRELMDIFYEREPEPTADELAEDTARDLAETIEELEHGDA